MIYTISIITSKEKTIYVCDDTTLDEIREKAIKALKRGNEIIWQNGDKQWIEKNPIYIIKENREKACKW